MLLTSSLRINCPKNIKSRLLFLDTCVILDIIRNPTRSDIRIQEQAASLDLLRIAEGGEELIVFIAEQVRKEFLANVDSVQRDAKNALSKFQDLVLKLNRLAILHGASSDINMSHLKNYEIRCRNVADRWLGVGILISQSDQIVSRAFRRVNMAMTPAKRGKDSIKDCVILETYLEQIRKLRGDGFTAPAVFISSNTKDYAGINRAIVRNDVKPEFDELGLEYAPNMAAAKHFLNL